MPAGGRRISSHTPTRFFSPRMISGCRQGGSSSPIPAVILDITLPIRNDAAQNFVQHRQKRRTMKLTHQAAGTFAIAPTPFRDDGGIDDKSIDRLTDFYAEVGCNGITVLG